MVQEICLVSGSEFTHRDPVKKCPLASLLFDGDRLNGVGSADSGDQTSIWIE